MQPGIYEYSPTGSLFIIGIVIVIVGGSIALRDYTAEGYTLFSEIMGFKMFLSATETERLKIIGTPPTKTPELYEKYLPYAMALGVEDAWSKQFAPLFKQMLQENRPYQPTWHHGLRTFKPGELGRSLSSNLGKTASYHYNALSASSSSLSKGSKFSGGGRGGGGGSSW